MTDNISGNKGGPGLQHFLNQRLEMRFSPQMVQAMEILQLPMLELQVLIKQEMEVNPTLEMTDEAAKPEDKTTDQSKETPDEGGEGTSEPDTVEILDRYREEATGTARPKPRLLLDKKWELMQNIPDTSRSIQEYLNQQFNLLEMDEGSREIGRSIIYNIDNTGYLKISVEEIAQLAQTNAAKVQEILTLIQQFDPPGIAARNLEECLLLQLTEDDPNLDLKKEIISNYLADVQKNQLPKLASDLMVPMEELNPVIQEIKQLNPHPGVDFSNETVPEVIPDVIVTEVDDGYEIKLNTDYIPLLHINPYYQRMLSNPQTPMETREYIKKKIESANQIILAIKLRQKTLLRIAQEIIKSQKDFLEKGPAHLKPLKMQEIAERLSVHLTTVSRAISARPRRQTGESKGGKDSRSLALAKYIQTPRGVFSMKFFFSRPAQTTSPDARSNRAVFMTIKDLIEKENKHNPLSDDEILKILHAKGNTIARRTVAKYRQMLNIPPVHLRKQY